MGKPSDDASKQDDAVSLASNPGESSSAAFAPYTDNDILETTADAGFADDEQLPLYSDAVGDELASAPVTLGGPAAPPVLDIAYFKRDQNTGAEYYISQRFEDPALLEKYIRAWARQPPRPFVHLRGTHQETRTKNENKTETVTVVDFDVRVDLTPYLYSDAENRHSWSTLRAVGSFEKARRGTVFKTRGQGKPPSLDDGATDDGGFHSLTEWCHRFCANHSGLKCFTLARRVTGFDQAKTRERLVNLVRGTNYRGRVSVDFPTQDSTVNIYNATKINEWRLTLWIKMLFIFTLMFIFAWPYLLLRTKRYEVAYADWPFSRSNDDGRKEYVSISEEQWYNMWARAIAKAILERQQRELDQGDLARSQEPGATFETTLDVPRDAMGLVQTAIGAMGHVNRQFGWGGDC